MGGSAGEQAEPPQQACQRELPSALGAGIYGSHAVQARLLPRDYGRGQHRGMPDKLLGTPKSHSRRGGCWHQAPACSGSVSAGGTAQSPALLSHPQGWSPQELPVCAAWTAGLIDAQLSWGGRALSRRGSQFGSLPYDAAFMPETHRLCQLFGQTPVTAVFHSCSGTGGAEALLGPWDPPPCYSSPSQPRTRQLLHPICPH